MQIVVELPEETIKEINYYGTYLCPKDEENFINAFKNKIILPKGHGRLIDADALMVYCRNQKSRTIDCNDIARFPTAVPTVLEAESEE